MKIVYALLCLALARWIIAYEVYHSLPLSEIKRRARSKDKKFTALYRVASYRDSQAVLLWLAGISAGTVLLIWSARTNWWLAAIVVVVTVWMMVWPR
ncbi:MAG TPA: hypothetical protein VFW90_04460, partial [Candidatus Saccharimonadales bacterium]|nr:hypothetical protein [Candidatus Saccharimonadales bacterium]